MANLHAGGIEREAGRHRSHGGPEATRDDRRHRAVGAARAAERRERAAAGVRFDEQVQRGKQEEERFIQEVLRLRRESSHLLLQFNALQQRARSPWNTK